VSYVNVSPRTISYRDCDMKYCLLDPITYVKWSGGHFELADTIKCYNYHVILLWSLFTVSIMLFCCDLYLQWLSCYSVVIIIYSDYHVIQLWSLFTVIIMLFCCDHYLQWLSCYSVVIIIYSDYHVILLWSLFTVWITW
jgi:hypothetical protein